MNSDIAIKLTNVSKYYKLYEKPKDRLKEALSRSKKVYHKKFYATKNLDLEVKKGEILGIVGKNGCGKSTLLKLITGVLVPDEGTVEVDGKISALLELGSGFNPEFTGMQNIFFYGTILGFTKQEMEKKVDDIIAFADIGEFIDQSLKTYSSGMKSRLGFAVAVHIEPEILILDEVLSVGDVLFKRKCYVKMEEFFKSGKTIIYVSHDASSIKQLCTRAIFLLDGNILLDADAKTTSIYYEKYLFAKNGNIEKIEKEILELSTNKNIDKNIDKKVKNNVEKKEQDLISPFYVDGMKSDSSVEYKNYDVKILNIHIETLDGEKVNSLVQDKEYIYVYKVIFGLDLDAVFFGTRIKDIKGVRISGASTSNAKIPMLVGKGDTYTVKMNFYCRLLEGIYYADTGISAIINGEELFLNRIVDAYMFKVEKKKNSLYAGIISLDQKFNISKEL